MPDDENAAAQVDVALLKEFAYSHYSELRRPLAQEFYALAMKLTVMVQPSAYRTKALKELLSAQGYALISLIQQHEAAGITEPPDAKETAG